MEINKFSVKGARDYLVQMVSELNDDRLNAYCYKAINEMVAAETPASTKHHHVYRGGLVVHTAEVTEYCAKLGFFLDENEYEALIYAAILHDHKKIDDYGLGEAIPNAHDPEGRREVWVKTKHGVEIYHIVHGYAALYAEMKDRTDLFIADVYHCMLAHHGRPEWGSAIEPQSHIAAILHMADYWSAKGGPAKNAPSIEQLTSD